MMAKMFYTFDDVKAALGKDDEEINALTRDGRLREFKDGSRRMFKADQVEALKNDLEGGGSDRIDLGPSDSGSPIGLADSRSDSGAILSLSDSIGAPGGDVKNDTALAADLGLSGSIGLSQSIGSIGGMPSPSRPNEGSGGSGSGLSGLGNAGGSKGGINVLGDEDADPSAQTAVNPAMNENMNLEGIGSGSGLLDLTRESDNTSLGAVLDEIGGSVAGGSLAGGSFAGGSLAGGSLGGTRAAETMGGTGAMSSGMGNIVQSRIITPPTYVEAKDPLAPAFGGAALAAVIVTLVGILALAGGVMNVQPALIAQVAKQSFMILALGSVGVALLGFIFGLLLGKIRG